MDDHQNNVPKGGLCFSLAFGDLMKVIQRYIGRRWNLPEIDSMCEATLITSDFEDKVSH